MKKLHILLSLFALSTLNINSQTYKVIDTLEYLATYSYEFLTDSTNKSSIKFQEMHLLMGQNQSVFQHSSKILIDSLIIAYKDEDPKVAFLKIMSMSNGNRCSLFTQYRIVKHKTSFNTELYEKVGKLPIVVKENNKLNWQLFPKDTIKILGFTCYKATTQLSGRKYTAWYTSEIPINDGPYKFKGLPGLIMKLSDNTNSHCFELTSLTPFKNCMPIYLTKENYKELSQEEYNNAKKVDLLNKMKRYTNPANSSASPEKLARMEARMQRENNYIEKY